jgi:hypothetical protein
MKKHLDTWNHFLNESKLRVFDFDDTLAVTDADVLATRADGTEFKLSPSEYAVYEPIAEYNLASCRRSLTQRSATEQGARSPF